MSFQKYITPFASILSTIEPDALSNDIYANKYLTHLLENKAYYLSIYAECVPAYS